MQMATPIFWLSSRQLLSLLEKGPLFLSATILIYLCYCAITTLWMTMISISSQSLRRSHGVGSGIWRLSRQSWVKVSVTTSSFFTPFGWDAIQRHACTKSVRKRLSRSTILASTSEGKPSCSIQVRLWMKLLPQERMDWYPCTTASQETDSIVYDTGYTARNLRARSHRYNPIVQSSPTLVAAKYHSMKVYLQVQQWNGEGHSFVNGRLGMEVSHDDQVLRPVTTDLAPAPEPLVRLVRCNCLSHWSSMKCTCRKHKLECSPECGQCKGSACTNSSNTVDGYEVIGVLAIFCAIKRTCMVLGLLTRLCWPWGEGECTL